MRNYVRALAFASILSGLMACSGPSAPVNTVEFGPWTLDNKASHINYTTIKQGDIAESNSFELFSGSVSPSGEAIVEIALNSLNTYIDTRDERMKAYVFKTEEFPSATITATLPMSTLKALTPGDRKRINNEITVSLAGVEENFDTNFMITPLGSGDVLVETYTPIIVHTDDFNLGGGVNKLKELAKLDSITPVVSVSFSLMYKSR